MRRPNSVIEPLLRSMLRKNHQKNPFSPGVSLLKSTQKKTWNLKKKEGLSENMVSPLFQWIIINQIGYLWVNPGFFRKASTGSPSQSVSTSATGTYSLVSRRKIWRLVIRWIKAPKLWCKRCQKFRETNSWERKGEIKSGWWFFATRLKNMSSSFGMMRFPIYAK